MVILKLNTILTSIALPRRIKKNSFFYILLLNTLNKKAQGLFARAWMHFLFCILATFKATKFSSRATVTRYDSDIYVAWRKTALTNIPTKLAEQDYSQTGNRFV